MMLTKLKKIGDVETYTNRYGDVYTFTLLESRDVQWSGKFEYCRVGCANDYTKAYTTYLKEGGSLTLPEFKEEIHRAVYDDQGGYVSMSELHKAYSRHITIDQNIIEMVDPSGGPYLSRGMELVENREIINFRKNEKGYVIVLE
jgi:hypothetical protein